jgi:DNA helicase-2/ATP-dependent DNA helicase PcrA
MAVFEMNGSAFGGREIDFAKELNSEQFAVVEGGDGRVLVLAGAGSGKTRTLVYRVAYLLEQGVRPDEILLLTFTNKAAREMLDRVAALLGRPVPDLWGGTFHSVANRILRADSGRVGLQKNFTIMDEEDARELMKLAVKQEGVDTTEKRFPSSNVIKSISSYSRNASKSLLEVIERKYPQWVEIENDISRVISTYDAKKKAANVVDFDDLLVLLRRMLVNSDDARKQWASRFKYVLVDEFQDTNALQSGVVDALSSVHGNLLVVGDDAQSIYSFRAADVGNILSFPKRYSDAKTFRLECNYRSTPQILELANESIALNTRQFKKNLKSMIAGGEKPFLVPCSSAREEATFIAEMMLKLQTEGRPFSDMCVLFRAAHHSQALEFELMKRGIPYEYRGGMKFFERSHVKDALAFVRLVANPKDEMAWMRILLLGKGIGEAAARKAFLAQRDALTFEMGLAMIPSVLTARSREGWKEIEGVLRSTLAVSDNAGEMIRAVAKSAYKDILAAEFPNFDERLEDLEQLAVFSAQYAEVSAFLAEVSLYDGIATQKNGGADDDVGEDHAVLSTIHQAKGLEWHTIFVIHLCDQYFPNKRAMDESDGLEEERRLFYVAVTRAARKLFLTYPAVMGEEYVEIVQPSLFIDELAPRLYERLELKYKPKPKGDMMRGKSKFGETAWKTDTVWKSDDDFTDDVPTIAI